MGSWHGMKSRRSMHLMILNRAKTAIMGFIGVRKGFGKTWSSGVLSTKSSSTR